MVPRIFWRRKTITAMVFWLLIVLTVVHLWLIVLRTPQNHDGSAAVRLHFLTVVFGKSNQVTHRDDMTKEMLRGKRLFLNQRNVSFDGSDQQEVKLKLNKVSSHYDGDESSNNGQQCKIPDIDPFHVDARSYIDYKWRNKGCDLLYQRGEVHDGKLTLVLENVQRAGFYYVRRKDDNENELSEWHPLRETHSDVLKHERASCMMISHQNLLIVPKLSNSEIYGSDPIGGAKSTESTIIKNVAVVAERNIACLPHYQFMFTKHGIIKHVSSKRCIVPRGDLNHKPLILSNDPSECTSDVSKFTFLKNGIVKHVSTGNCIVVVMATEFSGYFKLGDCKKATKVHFFQMEYLYDELNVTVPLKEDIVKLEYVLGHTSYTEHFIYPLKHKAPKLDANLQKVTSQDNTKLNVMLLLIGSVSHASVQRYLNASYRMLSRDPNSVILKSHTIVGDGATPQLLAMLTGKQQHDLPETRQGLSDRSFMDGWPFIWKDFEKHGYTTLYSEDTPVVGALNSRQIKFDEPPTVKYIRPWWIEMDSLMRDSKKYSSKCPHNFALKYLKDMFREYNEEKKFLFHAFNLGRDAPNRVTSIDEDLVDFFTHLNKTRSLNKTMLFVLGDHGYRGADFRTTLQGKLEERLPFFSITFPAWFHQKYPEQVQNLKRNSKVLTSHYDIYSTFKHLLTFPAIKHNHQFGKSLFTNIAGMKRKCENAGVDMTWCPCLQYKRINSTERSVVKMTMQLVMEMNMELRKDPSLQSKCHVLQLKNIMRVEHLMPNKEIELFAEKVWIDECANSWSVVDCRTDVDRYKKFQKHMFEVVFEVSPSNAQYKMTFEYDVMNNKLILPADFLKKMTRLNEYDDNQTKCIGGSFSDITKICYCM